MNKIIDDLIKSKNNKKFDNEDVAKELLDQYLLESKDEFKYFINFYDNKIQMAEWSRRQYYKDIIINKLIKLHIYNEVIIVYRIIRNIFGIFLVPFYILKLIFVLINRLKNILLKGFKRIIK